mmetsp:Transcript_10023/g.11122  ORF Transcript_10023/g.11122 Transcript_10023/m.11122 type:complete len:227 (-) Transcript_10023:146-826(-)
MVQRLIIPGIIIFGICILELSPAIYYVQLPGCDGAVWNYSLSIVFANTLLCLFLTGFAISRSRNNCSGFKTCFFILSAVVLCSKLLFIEFVFAMVFIRPGVRNDCFDTTHSVWNILYFVIVLINGVVPVILGLTWYCIERQVAKRKDHERTPLLRTNFLTTGQELSTVTSVLQSRNSSSSLLLSAETESMSCPDCGGKGSRPAEDYFVKFEDQETICITCRGKGLL